MCLLPLGVARPWRTSEASSGSLEAPGSPPLRSQGRQRERRCHWRSCSQRRLERGRSSCLEGKGCWGHCLPLLWLTWDEFLSVALPRELSLLPLSLSGRTTRSCWRPSAASSLTWCPGSPAPQPVNSNWLVNASLFPDSFKSMDTRHTLNNLKPCAMTGYTRM